MSTSKPQGVVTKDDRRRTVTTESGRQIGYVFIEPKEEQAKHRSTAIVYFYPLSCTSQILEELFQEKPNVSLSSTSSEVAEEETTRNADDYRCSFVCVDRPEYRDTSALEEETDTTTDDSEDGDEYVHRIRRHADDVLHVLRHESITNIYVLGACLGHPFAIEVCRRILAENDDDTDTSLPKPKLNLLGLNLLAPFISPACPHSWKVARLGAMAPSVLLRIATYAFSGLEGSIPAVVLGFAQLKARCYGTTTESDEKSAKFTRLLEIMQEMGHSSTASSRAMEARLGVAESWQGHICDKFAEESGCRLLIEKDESNEDKPSECRFPVRIHASPEDKLVPLEAVQWIAKRCYGGSTFVTVHHKLKTHHEMILFGGDMGNPYLLRTMARDWGLLSLADDKEANNNS